MLEKTYKWNDIQKIYNIEEDRNSFILKSEKGIVPHYKRAENNYRVWSLHDLAEIGKYYSKETIFAKRAEEAPVLNFYIPKGGGSWKTTCAYNVASNLALNGLKVLVIDLDFQMNITKKFGINNLRSVIADGGVFHEGLSEVFIDGKNIKEVVYETTIPNVDIIPASSNLVRLEAWLLSQVKREEKLSKKLAPLKKEYDVIIMDNNPSWSQISINGLFACSLNVSAIGIDSNTTEAMPQFFETLEYAEIELNDLFLICGQDEKSAIKRDIKEGLYKKYTENMCKTAVRKSVKVDEANFLHIPVMLHEIKHEVADDFKKITEEVWVRALEKSERVVQ